MSDDTRRGQGAPLRAPDAADMHEAADGDIAGRRGFVALAVLGSCAVGAGVALPAAAFATAPLRAASTGGRRFVVARLDELQAGVPKRVSIIGDEVDAWTRAPERRLGSVWLLRHGERDVRALSVICPHLGCGIELNAAATGFACPCHDSAFGLDGERAAGPSPRAMDPLPVEVTATGDVAVTFKRFRIGVARRDEIG